MSPYHSCRLEIVPSDVNMAISAEARISYDSDSGLRNEKILAGAGSHFLLSHQLVT